MSETLHEPRPGDDLLGQAQPANDCVSLVIHQGEIFGLLGDNGAGKSTTVRQMVNLLRSTSGKILLFGRPIASEALPSPRRFSLQHICVAWGAARHEPNAIG
jgi:ABC-type multidrug transport system ATPase subunit